MTIFQVKLSQINSINIKSSREALLILVCKFDLWQLPILNIVFICSLLSRLTTRRIYKVRYTDASVRNMSTSQCDNSLTLHNNRLGGSMMKTQWSGSRDKRWITRDRIITVCGFMMRSKCAPVNLVTRHGSTSSHLPITALCLCL